ncbi:MAG: tetratricopeptide repeat protein [Pseudomonadota bacterium]
MSAILAIGLVASPTTASAQLVDPDAPKPEPILPDEDAIIPPVDDVPTPQARETMEPDDRLDRLFAELKRTRDERLAKPLADGIWAHWRKSGSATTDLFVEWANDAMRRGDLNVASDLLDQVVLRHPDYAEGWNRRATLHFQMNNFRKSMNDIAKVLELEPRHFGALSGMAAILERSGNSEAALDAWLKVAELYPAMKNAQDAIERLSEQLADDPV